MARNRRTTDYALPADVTSVVAAPPTNGQAQRNGNLPERGPGAAPVVAPGAPVTPEEDGPLTRMRLAMPSLTGTARACAQYVLANAWEVRGLSIREVAIRAGVSANAVNRFSCGLKYEGYRDFSQALTLDLGKILGAAYALPTSLTDAPGTSGRFGASSPPGEARVVSATGPVGSAAIPGRGTPEGVASVLARVFELEIEALQDTLRTLDVKAAERAVEALASAQDVLFIGTGAAMALSELAAYRLKVLGMRASWAGDPGAIVPEIHLLVPGDVVCAISYHGATRHIVDALEHARDRGLTTICITAVPGSAAGQRADIQLVAFGQQTALGFGQFASRVASATMLDALAAAVAWRRQDHAIAHAAELVAVMLKRNTVTAGRSSRPGAKKERAR